MFWLRLSRVQPQLVLSGGDGLHFEQLEVDVYTVIPALVPLSKFTKDDVSSDVDALGLWIVGSIRLRPWFIPPRTPSWCSDHQASSAGALCS
jgi:hypothetical protein